MILLVVVLSALNYIGVRNGSRLQTMLTIAKILAIAVVVIGGLILAA